ncbi:MAG: hypothetical protein AB1486_20700 [Planctomycetota bacterium]
MRAFLTKTQDGIVQRAAKGGEGVMVVREAASGVYTESRHGSQLVHAGFVAK